MSILNQVRARLEESFVILKTRNEALNETNLREGDTYLRKNPSSLQATKNPRVSMVVLETKYGKNWFFYLDGKCECAIWLEKFHGIFNTFPSRPAAMPHVVAGKLRGLGYPSYIYSTALNKGVVLASDGHTPDAAGLWESVARSTGSTIMYFDVINNKRVADSKASDGNVYKLLVPRSKLSKFK